MSFANRDQFVCANWTKCEHFAFAQFIQMAEALDFEFFAVLVANWLIARGKEEVYIQADKKAVALWF